MIGRKKRKDFIAVDTTYTQKIRLSYADINAFGRWRPAAILTAMQELATTHGETLGVGRGALFTHGLVWAMARTELRMEAYPTVHEEIILRTWTGKLARFFFPRHFSFSRADGTPLGSATSLWVLVDVNERRMVAPSRLPALPPTDDAPPPFPVSVLPPPPLAAEPTRSTRAVVFGDLDLNHHVNNCRYADYLCDLYGFDFHETHVLERFEIRYNQEVTPGHVLTLLLRNEEEQFSLQGTQEGDDRLRFIIAGSWASCPSPGKI